ncbi:AraC family transcriptional regulator [Pseudomonas sp. QLc11A]|uniref:Helix-turn-helix transcriptional regulator n=1 Tax=Pseudomonas azerbaijanorientalis TaxID=2842350 RepID=A0ABW8W7V1_9PSED
MQAFAHSLEARFRDHLTIEQYAVDVGISAAYLNALRRKLGGQSVLQMINERLVLDAKRSLMYTTKTINQISDSLGFSEPAYFSRLFKRCTGSPPKNFRLRR